MVRAIIFDIGGVIVDFTEQRYVAWLSRRVKISPSRLWRTLKPLIETMEYGRMDLDHAEKIFADHFNMPRSKLEWVEGWKKTAKPNRKVIALVKRLSKRYKIGMITNNTKSRYREVRALAIDGLVRVRAVGVIIPSCYVGMRKPSPNIYKLALKRMHMKAKDVIFIDNQPENVVGAKKVGIDSIRFRNYSQLLKDLRARGIAAK